MIERDGAVVAFGGVALGADGRTPGLCWDMVARDRYRAGLGRALTEARLAAALAPGTMQARLDTSQHSQGFYVRLGFVVERVTADGYGRDWITGTWRRDWREIAPTRSPPRAGAQLGRRT